MTKDRSQGFGHIGLILAVVGVFAIGGLVAWRFLGAKKAATDTAATSIAQQLATAKCDYDDKDLCKFFVSYKEHKTYKVASSTTDKESGQTMTVTYEVDGDKTHSVTTGAYASEMISVGSRVTYTKAADGTWWKQTVPENKTPEATTDNDPAPKLAEPSTDTKEVVKDQYKFIAKEACGNLTCFKYNVIVPESDTSEYIWFDTKDYQLRRSTSDSSASSSDMTFTYDNVTVTVPKNFKELAPNQVLMPGASEPTTIPTAADFQ